MVMLEVLVDDGKKEKMLKKMVITFILVVVVVAVVVQKIHVFSLFLQTSKLHFARFLK